MKKIRFSPSVFSVISVVNIPKGRTNKMPTEIKLYLYVFDVFAFILGAIVGSFLNVCIYRMPLGLSVNEPRRSFCPHCKKQIPWYRNIPIFSWLLLRGKCVDCGGRIAFRYFGVELLTAVLFLGLWLKCCSTGIWVLALPYWILAGLLIVATFIDFDYFIIPDEITLGGTVAGIIMGFAVPVMLQSDSHAKGAFWSVIGAVVGFLTLRMVVELGKLAFGKKKIAFDPAETFNWIRHGDDADLKVGEDTSLWSDFFERDSDRLIMICPVMEIDGQKHENAKLDFSFNQLIIGEQSFELDKVDSITGTCSECIIPREAMGLGDVKFISAIGAFLGWQAVFFTIMAGSFIGAFFGLATILARRREWSAKIPFGPYLALGALIWMFAGTEIVHWYFSRISAR